MSIKNKGVLMVGVPSMQDLQPWAEQSQSSEDYKQLTLETFEAAPQWLAERRVNVKLKPLSVSSDMERKSSICLRVRQISACPAVAHLTDVPNVVQIITDRFRAGMVPGRQHNGQHLGWKYMYYEGCVMVTGKLYVRSTRETKWE